MSALITLDQNDSLGCDYIDGCSRDENCLCKRLLPEPTPQDEPPLKKQALNDDTNKLPPTGVIEEQEEWFASQSLCTLTLHVKIFRFDEEKQQKIQTHLLNLHCVPSILAINSKYFKTIIEGDPNVKEINLPDIFTYHEIGDCVTVAKTNDVIELFIFLHSPVCTQRELEANNWALLLMLFYIDCPLLFKQVEQEIDVTNAPDLLESAAWADFFHSSVMFHKTISALRFKILTGKNKWCRDTITKTLKYLPIQVTQRILTDVLMGPEPEKK
jgi:hypothetical protein